MIDAGTAITFDCLSAKGDFIGGAIIPGPSLQLSSMNAQTAQLPAINDLSSPPPLPATSTEMCMQSGVWYGIAGALEKMLQKYEEQLGAIEIYTCGGAWKSIAPLVAFDYSYEESLTLIGTALFD